MQHQDKGLVHYKGQALVTYAIAALRPLSHNILLSANRNQASYQQFGYPVLSDHYGEFAGPLAGMLSALTIAHTDILLVIPCDAPLLSAKHLQRLLSALNSSDADVAIACEAERWHAVVLALKTQLQNNLQAYLDSGERKVTAWLSLQRRVMVDFSAEPQALLNVNTLAALQRLENGV